MDPRRSSDSAASNPDATLTEEIGLPVRITERLESVGIRTLGDLLRMSSAEISALSGLSKHSITLLQDFRTNYLQSQRQPQ